MHPAPLFLESDPETLLARVRDFPFGLVCANGETAPLAAHTPVLASLEGGAVRLRFHLSAHNPLARRLEAGAAALIVFTGPNAYISPDWYGPVPNQVPTWNYLSVEAEGTPAPTDAAAFLDALSARFEAALAPKPPWTRDKMDPGAFDMMLRGIRAFELTPLRFEGITKLSQNKTSEAREGVMAALSALPDGDATANEMRKLNP
ncbi:MAG: FMN-binding negative transcriptional regulator [Hyphomonas sp.]|uniref:FMN-binding negative transcriptional regulator n=1 Tax=Hyphomonas sp. TaxID=87 RepID=UPI0017F788AB|nr:FMN-binding negative transcriptional regulator [Hyphomonas sp.]MBA3067362.1 FMN-binding negative transcriptional regulator [Hyphomonas sp.]MBU3921118.1 FMN-binding negative transcriptional regulator [Alphaproteobacteria bacterium]MBU4063051.1 FMN-binding negative transcriptional regulator [Alphaproteobacteria bacterium]MBU4163632.1 FMN-binding negative transcriptional regulator [Alphaproteobacteria bacterium]